MNLGFLNPLFLFGLAAGILPILIHRLTRRKAISRKFSAVRLLLQSQRLISRPQRLKNLLLLALRVLAVISLAFMMARPVLTHQGVLGASDGGAKVIIIDNSLSMSYREEKGERYDLAKKAAKEVLDDFKGQVILIPTAPIQDRPAKDASWMNPQEALRELAATPLSFGRGDPASAMALAYRQLKDLKIPKEILIITDMARGDWEGFDLSKLAVVSADVGITFLRIGGATRDSNFAVRGVRLAEGETIVGVPARLEVTVSNFSDQSGSTLVQLYLSGVKVDQKSVELKGGVDGLVFFELYLEKPGWIDGEIRLPGDSLPLDDVLYFPLKVREKVKVLIVDGDPRISLKASESYFLVNALNPGGSEGSPFTSTVITEGEMAGVDPKPYDALFLLNVARPQPSKVASFLESRKPVFIFLGDRATPGDYNGLPFFPWRLTEVREVKANNPEKIAQVDYSHEALKPLLGPGGESLRGASFRHYFGIEGSTKNLLTLQNKDPLLVESDSGKGRLFLFASSADLDWNDLPLKAAYLPLIQGLLKEAVRLTRDSLPAGIRIGEPSPEKTQPIQVIGTRKGPGIYKFPLPAGEMRRGVNLPLEESDLAKMTEKEIKRKMGTMEVKVVEYREGAGGFQAGRKELWPLLLAFLLTILAVEMVVANRI